MPRRRRSLLNISRIMRIICPARQKLSIIKKVAWLIKVLTRLLLGGNDVGLSFFQTASGQIKRVAYTCSVTAKFQGAHPRLEPKDRVSPVSSNPNFKIWQGTTLKGNRRKPEEIATVISGNLRATKMGRLHASSTSLITGLASFFPNPV